MRELPQMILKYLFWKNLYVNIVCNFFEKYCCPHLDLFWSAADCLLTFNTPANHYYAFSSTSEKGYWSRALRSIT